METGESNRVQQEMPAFIRRTNSRTQTFVNAWRAETLCMAIEQACVECESAGIKLKFSRDEFLKKCPYLHVLAVAGAFLLKSLGFPLTPEQFEPANLMIPTIRVIQAATPSRVLVNFLDNPFTFIRMESKEQETLARSQLDYINTRLCGDSNVTRFATRANDDILIVFVSDLLGRFGLTMSKFNNDHFVSKIVKYDAYIQPFVPYAEWLSAADGPSTSGNRGKRKRETEKCSCDEMQALVQSYVTEIDDLTSEINGYKKATAVALAERDEAVKCRDNLAKELTVQTELSKNLNDIVLKANLEISDIKSRLREAEADRDKYMKSGDALAKRNAEQCEIIKCQEATCTQISERNSKLQGDLAAAETLVKELNDDLQKVKASPNLFCSMELEHSQRIRQKQCQRLCAVLKEMESRNKQWKINLVSVIQCLATEPINKDDVTVTP